MCGIVEGVSQLVDALAGLRSFHSFLGEHRQARELGEECLQLARQTQDMGLQLTAHLGLAITEAWTGRLLSARAHGERGLALATPQPRVLTVAYGYDAVVGLLALSAWSCGC